MSFFIKGHYRVVIAGQDVTSRFRPLLKDLSIDRSAGSATDTLSMTLADPNARVVLPSDRAPVTVEINGAWAFEGFVSDASRKISKGAGREIAVSASSADPGGKVKEPSLRHMDEASLADVAKSWGAKAGLEVQVLGSLASVHRDYWLQQNESFVSWLQRTAREVGGTAKIIGSRAYLSPRNEGFASSGRPLTAIAAQYGVNLKEADISPMVSRPRFSNVVLSYFDRAKGERMEVDVDTGLTDVQAKLRSLVTAATKGQAEKKAEALGKESDREKGSGNVTITGDERAEPEAECHVSGVGPGADGTYQIDSLSHRISKGEGFTTSLSLKQPKAGAGSDRRAAAPADRAPPSAIGVGPR